MNHSYSIDHLRNLLTKGKDWTWTEKHSEAFKRLKNDFAECITLKHVIPERQFRLQTDASDRGISGILYQIDAKENHNVIGEVNYTTTEKERLAIIYSIEKFRVYLIGVRFLIITDHQCLTFLNMAVFQNSRITPAFTAV